MKMSFKAAMLKRCKAFAKKHRQRLDVYIASIMRKNYEGIFSIRDKVESDIYSFCTELWVEMIQASNTQKLITAWNKKYKKKHNTEEFALTSLYLKYFDKFKTMLLNGLEIKHYLEDYYGW